jgi:hypothetical protein
MSKRDGQASTISALKDALSNRGYALRLSTESKGDTLTATLSLLDMKSDRSLFKLVASGRMADVDLTVGLDLPEDALWDSLQKLVDLLDSLKDLVPFEIAVSR